jgi:chromosome segregation ATPase
MESYQIKSDLQELLDSDIQLRKEYTELKRALSDYRNQLISRDEDCKRLQVTIDILNTKLVVMERDNTAFKTELSTLKEIRDTVNDQLASKQSEIDAVIQRFSVVQNEFEAERSQFSVQLNDIKARAEAERIQLDESWQFRNNQQIEKSKSELEALKAEFINISEHREFEFNTQIQHLQSQLSVQKHELETQLKQEWLNKEADYIAQINNLNIENSNIAERFNVQFEALQEQHALALSTQLSDLKTRFESETSELIHNHEDTQNDKWALHFSQQEQFLNRISNQIQGIYAVMGLQPQVHSDVDVETSVPVMLNELHEATASVLESFKRAKDAHAAEIQDLTHTFNNELQVAQQHTNAKQSGYDELLLDNTSLNAELDALQLEQVQLKDHIALLASELEEARNLSRGKAQDIQDLITEKNFEFIALQSELAALREEVNINNRELANKQNEYLATEHHLKQNLLELEDSNASYQREHLKLLNEKDQLANQLIRMNEILSGLSQNVESQNINVDALQAHRKNVILASESGEIKDKSHMKEQIHELVREIDKCIALLGA